MMRRRRWYAAAYEDGRWDDGDGIVFLVVVVDK